MPQAAFPDTNVNDVVAGLVGARDAQIARVVAMVDDMPDRGAADALIAPLRGRLAQLRPARPFGFTRLLFSPLDPVIMSGARWRRGDLGVPRPALAPLGQALQRALPTLSQTLEPGACRVTPDDRSAIAALGASLWPAAAEVLESLPPPPNWTQASGLPEADFAGLAAVITALLRQAPQIEALALSRDPPGDAAIRVLLAGTERYGGVAIGTTISVLLARLSVPARVLAIGTEIGAGLRPSPADRAMEHVLTGLQAMADGSDNGEAAEVAVEVGRVASLLSMLEGDVPVPLERRRRLEQMRKDADALCRKRFERTVTASLEQAGATVGHDPDDEAITTMESTARDLRRLEGAGRRLGSGEHYDSMVQAACAPYRTADNRLCLAERVRMVEILAGPEEALALLAKG